MFPITTDAHDFGDEDDGPMTSFDDAQIQVDHEVWKQWGFAFKIRFLFEWFQSSLFPLAPT